MKIKRDIFRSPVIYQVYPRSYQDTKGSGVGDLRGIIDRLDHIASLGGVDYVWISPFFKSPMKDGGYDVSDYYSVDPMFGQNDDFDELLEKANKLGLRIMVDLVMVHTSDQHEWFRESRQNRTNPKADWYVWADAKPDGTPPNNWLSMFTSGPAWIWDSKRKQYYRSQFLPSQPALNYNNPEVVQEMFNLVRHWADKGVKGFRLDVIAHITFDNKLRNNPVLPAEQRTSENPFDWQVPRYSHARPEAVTFIKELRKISKEYKDICLLGEIDQRSVARKYVGRDKLHTCYFFDLVKMKSLQADALQEVLVNAYRDFPDYAFCWALSNHDYARHVGRLAHDPALSREFAKMTGALFLFMPGGYCIYQGEELGLPAANLTYEQLVDPQDKQFFPGGQQRDRSRTPMVWEANAAHGGFSEGTSTWLPVDPRHAPLAADQQQDDKDSVLNFYRRMLQWRNESISKNTKIQSMEVIEKDVFHIKMQGKYRNLQAYFNLSERGCDIPPEQLGEEFVMNNDISEAYVLKDGLLHLPPYGFAISVTFIKKS